MKKALFMGALAALMFLVCHPVYAAHEEGGGYVGIAASYAIPNFDTDLGYDSSWGLNAHGGYHFNKWVSLGLAVDYLAEFEVNETLGWGFNVNDKVSLTTLMADFRVSPGLSDENLAFYLIGGLGYMWAEDDGTVTLWGTPYRLKDDASDLCGQLGGSVELFPESSVSVVLDARYVWGFNDLTDIQYTNISLGVRHNF